MKDNVLVAGGNILQYVLAAIQANEILQWVELGLSILTTLILIAHRLWVWHKEAKADGKITADELKEAIDIAQEGAEAIKEQLDKGKEDRKDGDND